MVLEGIHHITAITADARQNLDFYQGLLGLRLVAKSINQDDAVPTYHLFYADEYATPGTELTFFEYPGVPVGRAGDGMVHRIAWRVGSRAALAFWSERLERAGIAIASGADADDSRLEFADPEGLALELAVVDTAEPALAAQHPDIPAEFALLGFGGVRAYAADPSNSRGLLEQTLAFQPAEHSSWRAGGSIRTSTYAYDDPPPRPGLQGAGTVHHVAWRAASDEEHPLWRERLVQGGASPTPVIDRFYFRSIYFREPSGVLFEIASPGPGFTRDTPLGQLGDAITLPPWLEPRRTEIESNLTPLPTRSEMNASGSPE